MITKINCSEFIKIIKNSEKPNYIDFFLFTMIINLISHFIVIVLDYLVIIYKKLSKFPNIFLQKTIKHINIDLNIAKILKICRSVIQVKFPVKINGKVEIFYGWRAVHSNHRLPV